MQAADDQVALLHARYEVRRAEIEVSGNEFVGTIEAEKNDAGARGRQAGARADRGATCKTHADEQPGGARRARGEAEQGADGAMQFAQRTIESMTVKAPIAGLVVIKENRDASGGFVLQRHDAARVPRGRHGAAGPRRRRDRRPLRDGDQGQGRTRPTARRSTTGASANVSIEALPGAPLTGSTKGVGGLAQNAFWEPETTRQFDASFALIAARRRSVRA